MILLVPATFVYIVIYLLMNYSDSQFQTRQLIDLYNVIT